MNQAVSPSGQGSPTTVSTGPPTRDDETSWLLGADHDDEVVYDNNRSSSSSSGGGDGGAPTVKAGTLAGLVEYLTRHDTVDSSFNQTFLLTYRSFTSTPDLFRMLVQRFNIEPPAGLTTGEFHLWTQEKQKVIQDRVINVLKRWLEHFWAEPDNATTRSLLGRIHKFASTAVQTPSTPGLLSVIEQRRLEEQGGGPTTLNKTIPIPNAHLPAPILPKKMKVLKLKEISPIEIARQLTLIEFHLYSKIRLDECLNKAWQTVTEPGMPEPAPNIRAVIHHSNQLANWVGEMVLAKDNLKKRVRVVKQFVEVADACLDLKNYSTVISIISGLGTAPVHRLGRTWSQVSERTCAMLEPMRRLVSSTKNFAEYRETLRLANLPCIPFLGVYLMDLTFNEDGNPSLTSSGSINFSKRTKAAAIIKDIQRFQRSQFLFQPVPVLQEFLITNLQAAGDVHEMHERSVQLEPKRAQEDNEVEEVPYVPTGTAMSSILIASMAMR